MTPALKCLKSTSPLPFTKAVPNPDREGGASSGTSLFAGAPQ